MIARPQTSTSERHFAFGLAASGRKVSLEELAFWRKNGLLPALASYGSKTPVRRYYWYEPDILARAGRRQTVFCRHDWLLFCETWGIVGLRLDFSVYKPSRFAASVWLWQPPVHIDLLAGARMPIYFFHIRDGDTVILDEEGAEFADTVAASEEARASASDLASELVREGHYSLSSQVELTDEDGAVLFIVPLKLFISRH